MATAEDRAAYHASASLDDIREDPALRRFDHMDPLAIPAQFQGRAYASAILEDWAQTGWPDGELDRRVERRVESVRAFRSNPDVHGMVFVHEASLRRQVGNAAIMFETVMNVCDWIERQPNNVEVRLLSIDDPRFRSAGDYHILQVGGKSHVRALDSLETFAPDSNYGRIAQGLHEHYTQIALGRMASLDLAGAYLDHWDAQIDSQAGQQTPPPGR